MRRKAAFNKSLIKGKQRGRRLSSSLFLDSTSPSLPSLHFSSFLLFPDRPSFSVSRLLVYPRHARLISPLSFSVFHARRDYIAGQQTWAMEEERKGRKRKERGGKAKRKIRKKGSQLSRTGGSIENRFVLCRFVLSFSSKSMRIEAFSF